MVWLYIFIFLLSFIIVEMGGGFCVPCIVFTGHPSLRLGDAVHFMETWSHNSANCVIFTGMFCLMYFMQQMLSITDLVVLIYVVCNAVNYLSYTVHYPYIRHLSYAFFA